MKIHVLSDLHIEFGPFVPPQTDADVVVLAGDIHTKRRAFAWARKAFPRQKIVATLGNHEFYGEHWSGLIGEMRKQAVKNDVVFLENDSVEINGVRFLGSTLWFDFLLHGEKRRTEAEAVCTQLISDFRQIRVVRSGTSHERAFDWTSITLPPTHVVERHNKSRKWLAEELEKPFSGRTVVVTHHLPSMRSVAPRFSKDLSSAAFASNLDDLVPLANLWIHGHTHDSFDYSIGDARVVCNPRGYCDRTGTNCENPRFIPEFCVEI